HDPGAERTGSVAQQRGYVGSDGRAHGSHAKANGVQGSRHGRRFSCCADRKETPRVKRESVSVLAIFQQSETRVRDCAVAVLKLCGGDSGLCCPQTTLENTARQSEGRSFLEFLLAAASKLRGSFSVDEFSVEVTDAVAPVLVFAEFCLCGAAESFFFQGIQL